MLELTPQPRLVLRMGNKIETMRDPRYLDFIRRRPCWFCGKLAEPHHSIRHFPLISEGGIGVKGSDYLAVPLCRLCHEQMHSGHMKVKRELLMEIIITQLISYIARGLPIRPATVPAE